VKHSESFQVELDNIPLINLRNEFNSYYALFQKVKFQAQFVGEIKPIETPYMTWFGTPEAFLTLLLQKAILGIEAYLPGAVFVEMGLTGKLNQESVRPVKNPWLLGGRTVTENYYHRLPALLKDDASLKQCNNTLWDKNTKFYSEIRNPLFHGHQLSRSDLKGFLGLLEHVASLYDWIDGWHSPENIIKGGNVLSRTRTNSSSNKVSKPTP
jgi:hypothetical protein